MWLDLLFKLPGGPAQGKPVISDNDPSGIIGDKNGCIGVCVLPHSLPPRNPSVSPLLLDGGRIDLAARTDSL